MNKKKCKNKKQRKSNGGQAGDWPGPFDMPENQTLGGSGKFGEF